MALVKYGGGIMQMSGSIGGQTHARNRYGNYVRSRTKPVNPNSAAQDIVRSVLATLSTRWAQTLTGVQRTAWNLYGDSVAMLNRLGEVVHLTGYNHYIRSNSIRLRTSRTVADDGPVIFEVPEKDIAFTITASEATQQVTCAFDNALAWSVETDGLLQIGMGAPQNAQRNFFDGPWRHMTQVDGIDPGGAVTPDVGNAPFGIAEGQRIWCMARISRADGRISTIFRDDVVVAA